MKNRIDLVKRKLNNDAVSQTISFILVMMVFFSATGAILVWSPGYAENEEHRQINEGVASQFDNYDKPTKNIVINGNGSIYNGELVITEGTLEIDSVGERLITWYSVDPDLGFSVTGLHDGDGDFVVTMDNAYDIDEVVVYLLEDTCFLAGTKITIADGSLKNIEDIMSGDLIKSYDEVSKVFVNVRVRKLLTYNADIMGDYYLKINNKLRVTPNHKIMINNNWVKADELSVGDVGLDSFARDVSLYSVEKKYSKETSYDLQLESVSIYFADGFMVRSDFEPIIISDGVSSMSSAPVVLDSLGAGVQGCTYINWDGDGRTLRPDKDATLAEDWPELNYGNNPNLCVDNMRFWLEFLWERSRSLIHFPLDQIPSNAEVNKAGLALYYHDFVEGNPQGQAIVLHEVPDKLDDGENIIWPEDEVTWYYWQNPQIDDNLWDGWCDCGSQGYPTCSHVLHCTQTVHWRRPIPPWKAIDSAIIPSNYDWVIWDDTPDCDDEHNECPESGYYYGLKNSVEELVRNDRVNNGWLISGVEVIEGGQHEYIKFYSKDEGVAGDYRPKLTVWYVESPEILDYEITDANVGEDWVELRACLYDGLYYSDATAHNNKCNVKFGLKTNQVGGYTYIYDNDEWTGTIIHTENGLTPGDLYFVQYKAENTVKTDYSYTKFFTVPPRPTSLSAVRQGSGNIIQCFFGQPTCGSGADVYTKVLARTDHYPDEPDEDITDPSNCEMWYYGDGSSHSEPVSPSTTYYIRAWTYAEEAYSPCYPPVGCPYLGRFSTNYRNKYMPADYYPDARYTWEDRDGSDNGKIIDFDASTSTDDKGIDWYFWDYDYQWIFSADNSSNQPLTEYEYPVYGNYVCALRVYDTINQWDQREHTVFVDGAADEPPYACFEFGDLDGDDSGTEFWFDASCSSDDGGIVNYSWDFENNSDWNAWDINVTFDKGDTSSYEVRLRVRDDGGQDDFETKSISLSGPPTPPKDFEVCLTSGWLSFPDDSFRFYNETGGEPYRFSCVSYDSDEYIWYQFDWGDGTNNTYYFKSGTPIKGQFDEVMHFWQESGVYDIKARALNDDNIDGDGDPRTNYSYASDWSDPIAIRVYYQYIVPPDADPNDDSKTKSFTAGNGLSGPSGGPYTVTTGMDLSGAVCIHLKSDDYPFVIHSSAKGNVPFGVIYLFDLGAISHRPSFGDAYKTVLQNGGVLSVLNGNINVRSYNNIYESGDTLGFYVTMIRGDRIISADGAGNYRLSFKNMDTYARHQDYTVYNFKVMLFGVYQNYWHEYLERNYLFHGYDFGVSYPDTSYSVYDAGNGKQLIFLSALFRTNLG
ncbi:MAG: DNRLRE domain-containing protein [Thermoplasmatales archaeon]|nr:DNRLRE domain-containing protein [Thermoplasmatales archaeon]